MRNRKPKRKFMKPLLVALQTQLQFPLQLQQSTEKLQASLLSSNRFASLA
jgi:hypothetical protein